MLQINNSVSFTLQKTKLYTFFLINIKYIAINHFNNLNYDRNMK